jgi:hypothetical protein
MARVAAVVLALVIGTVGPAATASPSYQVEELVLTSFTNKVLTSTQKKQIENFLTSVPKAEKLTCTALRLPTNTKAANTKLRASAAIICNYAKSRRPALTTIITSLSTSKNDMAGKFLLSAASQIPETVTLDIINQVPAEKSVASLKEHFEKIESLAQGQKPIALEYVAGPTTDPKKVQLVTDRFAQKLRVFQLLGLTKLNMDWVIASEKDYLWWRDYRSKQDKNYPLSIWDNSKNELGHCKLSSDIFCGAGNGFGGKNYQDNVVGTNFVDRGLDSVTRHEATHFYQAVFGYGGRCWFAEGQATFFETYLENSSRSRAQVIARILTSPTKISQSTLTELENKLENNRICSEDQNLAYDLGMLAVEHLYLNFSLKQVHDLQVASSGGKWDAGVRQILGVEPMKLNQEMAAYIFSQWK